MAGTERQGRTALMKSPICTILMNSLPYAVYPSWMLQNKRVLVLMIICSSIKQISGFFAHLHGNCLVICVTRKWPIWEQGLRLEKGTNNRFHSARVLETSLLPLGSDLPVSTFLFFLSPSSSCSVLPPHSSCLDYKHTLIHIFCSFHD